MHYLSHIAVCESTAKHVKASQAVIECLSF